MTVKSSLKSSAGRLLTGSFIVSLSLASVSSAYSSDTNGTSDIADATQVQDRYFQIRSVTVEEVGDPANDQNVIESIAPMTAAAPVLAPASPRIPSTSASTTHAQQNENAADKVVDLATDALDISEVVDVAKLAWDVVEANKPSSSVTSDSANAVPKNASWESIVGWSAPQSHSFHVVFTNNLGVNVIDFTYSVVYTYGGNVRGKGHFLNGVSIVPANITVDWGFTLAAQAKVTSVTNAGTAADPIAAMDVQMQWTISSMLKTKTQSQGYYVRGDGQFQTLN